MEEYFSNLEQRDQREQAQRSLIDHYSRIADRLATAETKQDGSSTSPADSSQVTGPSNASMRADLAAAQKARTALEQEVESLKKLKQQNAAQAQLLEARQKEIAALHRKFNDKTTEIIEGRKVRDQLHDEMVSLNLQLNMAEQKAEKLDKENKELVSRWMKRMGEEADRMNNQSKW